eukprot:CAMPEP_0181323344 /NCGR_PEP_ID=MMETSP1101-20121128/19732_1 /TAXON_ID=46948 /ORGANISM="Rhodomonas abbreviata, Strain Caron Lab Isolate" /LENGTH=145 /DNA_ID=CAMNT_0023431359 /DNA_START=27 /DNA_END=464 /DNA_ORIENTATION=+
MVGYGSIGTDGAMHRPAARLGVVHAMLLSSVAAVLLVIALASSRAAQQQHQHSLLQAYYLVPLSQGPPGMFYNQGHGYPQASQSPRLSFSGIGDLPMPIDDDGDNEHVMPGSNVHMFGGGVPSIPYGMDNRPDPPYIPSTGTINY